MPEARKNDDDGFYRDVRGRGDKVLRRLWKTKPDPKWNPPVTKRKAKQKSGSTKVE